jgi:heme exporter protein D
MENETSSLFHYLIWGGVAVSLIGLVGLIISIIQVSRAKRAKLNDEDMRAAIQKALPLNLGALFLSVIGLMMVILGLFLR